MDSSKMFKKMPLREVFVKRALWNMPRINPNDYKKPSTDANSPQLSAENGTQSPISVSTPPLPNTPPIRAAAKKLPPNTDLSQKEAHILSDKFEESLWVEPPTSSAPEKIKQLQKEWTKNPNLCRACADTFCRDETFGDPYLVECTVCRNKYHTFCVMDYKKHMEFVCTTCCEVNKPVKLIAVSSASLVCQLCHQNKNKGFEGRWVGPIPNIPGSEPCYVHENCAFYSKGVVKIGDQWCRIQSAIRAGHTTRCGFCDQKGASVPCDNHKCRKLLHYHCAKKNYCFVIDTPGSPQKLYCANHFESALASLNDNNPGSPQIQLPHPHLHHKPQPPHILKRLKTHPQIAKETPTKSPPIKRPADEENTTPAAAPIKLPRLSRDHNFPSVERLAEWDERYEAVKQEGHRKRVQKWESKIRCAYRKLKEFSGLPAPVMEELGKIADEMERRFPALTIDNKINV